MLDPTLDKVIDTSSLANDLNTEDLLYTLLTIPSDLFGFYTKFAVGVRRGLSHLLAQLGLGELTSAVIKPTYNPSTEYLQHSLKAADVLDLLRKKKKAEWDPKSPNSVNYSWGSGPAGGYEVQLAGQAPHQTGYYRVTQAGHSHTQQWGQGNPAKAWSRHQDITTTNPHKDINTNLIQDINTNLIQDINPNHKDALASPKPDKFTRFFDKYKVEEEGVGDGYSMDYDQHGNILFTGTTRREDPPHQPTLAPDPPEYKAKGELSGALEGAALPRIQVRRPPGHKQQTRRSHAGAGGRGVRKGTEYGRRGTNRGKGGSSRGKGGNRGGIRGKAWSVNTREKYKTYQPKEVLPRGETRRSTGANKARGSGGGRRFDQFAPNSAERRDVVVQRGEGPNKDYVYYDYLYYD